MKVVYAVEALKDLAVHLAGIVLSGWNGMPRTGILSP
jgi:hypothetical protein